MRYQAIISLLCLWMHSLASEPYVMGHLMGQFGNQMFIIAAATSLALDNGATPIFPGFVDPLSDPVFKLPYNYKHLFYHLNAAKPETEPEFVYNEPAYNFQPIPYQPNMKIFGWFQSEKYFKQHKSQILELFRPHPEIKSYLVGKYSHIIDHPKTVSVHLRSYLEEDPFSQVYNTYGRDYILKAVSGFPKDYRLIVFSNNMDWCKRELSNFPRELTFIEGETPHHDFYLMSLCKHNIIANSSFSWWAAYLNPNPKKAVIAPPHWFAPTYVRDTSDLIPPEWTILR